MKNKLTILLALSLLLFVVMGCSLGGLLGSEKESSSKDSKTKAADSKSTESQTEKEPSGEVVKVGIPECDELATYINDNSEEIEGSLVARGIVYAYKSYILDSIKEGVEKMNDEEKAKWGKACTESLTQLKNSMQK